jgi:GAF domain-containing protein
MYVPIMNSSGIVMAVGQVIRSEDWIPFAPTDEATAEFFQEHFAKLSHLFWRETQLVQTITQGTVFSDLTSRLVYHFHCRVAEIWTYDSVSGQICLYEHQKGFIPQPAVHCGAVGYCLRTCTSIQIADVMKAHGFSADIDGRVPETIMVVPIAEGHQTVAVAVRGRSDNRSYSMVDRMQLENVAPIVARSVSTGDTSSVDELGNDLSLRLKALLDVAEILSGVLDIDVLVPIIMSRACSLLRTERCSLFLVDREKQELVSRFHGGLDKQLRLPIGRGVVGHTATTGEIVNITDAYSDPRFEKKVDLVTGFTTRTILTVPIYNNRGEITGVAEMINRADGSAFDNDDIRMMIAFNVFCGISLDNAKLYTTSLDLARQLRGFVEMSTALNKTKTVRDVVEEILDNAVVVIHAARGTIFVPTQGTEQLEVWVNIGVEPTQGATFASNVAASRKTEIFGGKELDLLSRVTSVLLQSSRPEIDQENEKCDQVCDLPLIAFDGRLLGVMELACAWKILPEDTKLLECFAVFAAVSLEKSELQDVAKFGNVEQELKKWMTDAERKQHATPVHLKVAPDQAEGIYTVNFDAPTWDGIGYFKIAWAMLNKFNLLEEYKVPNETFFRFISKISATYNKVPYHNWRHAVDVTQFVTFEILTGHLETTFSKFELFGLLIAAICHDANHDGFTNVYNVKAETPLGILFKNQSVMETHHCEVAIETMSKAESNVFASLKGQDYKAMWSLIIHLILITDMAKHFEFLKMVNALLDEGPLDLSTPEHRLILMQLLLKCGDVSNVSRPFELADKWCDVLCEEFFRQGDLEMANGMEYTSPLNDREHLDKPKSQIGFYTFVCLPLYQTGARAVAQLQCNVDQVQSNLSVWKAAAEAAAAEAAATEAAAAK